jgi:hypothetical protein
LRAPKGFIVVLFEVYVEYLKSVEAEQSKVGATSPPGNLGSKHWDVMLWQVVRTPYAEVEKATLSGINAVAGTIRAVWSSANATELRTEALFNVRRPSGSATLYGEVL